jgi:preprotein translocase subunit SecD
MNKNLTWKVVLIVVVLMFFLFGIFGTPDNWKAGALAALQNRIHLGLDLRGGTHLILQVLVDDAVRADADNAIDRLKAEMRANNINYAEITQPDPQSQPDRIQIRGVASESSGDLRRIVQERLAEYDLASGPENSWLISMKPSVLTDLRNRAVTQAIETIRNRIDALGVSEPVIEEHGLGQYQILVQLPGVDDPARVKEIMQSTAMLQIKQAISGPFSSEAQALQQSGGVLPPDAMLLKGKQTRSSASGSERPAEEWWVMARSSAITGRDLRSADPSRDDMGRPDVTFSLTKDGGDRFSKFTAAHVGDKLAVVLDNKVQEVATINEEIHDQVQIKGQFSDQQAKDLAMILRSGALPAGIRYLEERTVGPSLGADSIRHGVMASVIGLAAVLLFMLIYYRGAGINADLALILNLIILLGFLGFSGATLTLPGIAGVILTVGMGVDSNVLIFERIREELRNGKTPPSAVQQGFAHAWTTIVDTHVTTIVSAAILFAFGTGAVKGFAVTLTFGLLANLFTAVFVSRVIFDAHLNRHRAGEALSI